MHTETRLTQRAYTQSNSTRAVNPPVVHASTMAFPTVESYLKAHDRNTEQIEYYGRFGTETQFELESLLAKLEGGYRTVLSSSGLGAIALSLISCVKPGQNVYIANTVYGPTREFCELILKRFEVKVTYYDPINIDLLENSWIPDTAVVYCESPGSVTLEMQDITKIADIAHKNGALVLADNTWPTPYFFQPFKHGIDISIQAATKYIVGHSDAMLGAITCTEDVWPQIMAGCRAFGAYVGPDDCYLAIRGLRTLGVRMQRHYASTLEIAKRLLRHPKVQEVRYPALVEDQGHELWKKYCTGASGILTIRLADGLSVDKFCDSLKYFHIGSSWGGFESLVRPFYNYPARTAPTGSETKENLNYVRLHIGLEDVEDLWEDLDSGLKQS